MTQFISKLDRPCITSGEIAGSLTNLIPFIYIARRGIRSKERNPSREEKKRGIFAISRVAGNGACPNIGIIVPISQCNDEKVRQALSELCHFLQTGVSYETDKEKREEAQTLLDAHLKGAFQIHERTELAGFIELTPNRRLFQILSKSCNYVDAIMDNPDGIVEPISYSRFKWSSYGEFMEWFYERIPAKHWGWEYCYPYFVYDQTCYLGAFRYSRDMLVKPTLELDKFFMISPHIENLPLKVEFSMSGYGWINLCLAAGLQTVSISLSNVYSPFGEMLEWLKMIDRGDVPISFNIDEEGTEKKIYAYGTDDPRRIFFRVIEPYDQEIVFLEGILDRKEFVSQFKTALRKFFDESFDSEKWREPDQSDSEDSLSIKNMILADPWIAE
jgi:hypothetical protein